ncbi:hypothetical protein B0H13DRAFT_1911678 [Mycena leptocephala]|nr:hypothetical protein B0H13DRAFT_1911678 [Mycena leptocephala]
MSPVLVMNSRFRRRPAPPTSFLSSRAIEKRDNFNVCNLSGSNHCVINEGTGPLEADCLALSNAIVAAFEESNRNCLPANAIFSVAPQFVQEFSLGTCLWAWINENPVNSGVNLQECYETLTFVLGNNLNSCIIAGDTGGFAIPATLNTNENPAALDWTFDWMVE